MEYFCPENNWAVSKTLLEYMSSWTQWKTHRLWLEDLWNCEIWQMPHRLFHLVGCKAPAKWWKCNLSLLSRDKKVMNYDNVLICFHSHTLDGLPTYSRHPVQLTYFNFLCSYWLKWGWSRPRLNFVPSVILVGNGWLCNILKTVPTIVSFSICILHFVLALETKLWNRNFPLPLTT